MKIAITSDLHADFGPAAQNAIKRQAERCAQQQADLLIVAGDLAVDEDTLGWCLETLRSACPVAWVFGNHDVWYTSKRKLLKKKQDAWYKALDLFPRIANQTSTHYLLDQPLFIRKDLAVCGNGGWYDYSSANPAFPMSQAAFAKKEFMGAATNDRDYAIWWSRKDRSERFIGRPASIPNTPDPEVAAFFLAALERQLNEAMKAGADIIAVSHMVPWREFMGYAGDPIKDYLDAFYGNMNIGRAYEGVEGALKLVVFEHTHQRVDAIRPGTNIRCINSPLGYIRKPSDIPDDLGLTFITLEEVSK